MQMSADCCNLAKRNPMFSSTYKFACKRESDLKPSFSIPSTLFCTTVQSTLAPNSFIFNDWRTLSDNYRGGGTPAILTAESQRGGQAGMPVLLRPDLQRHPSFLG